MYVIWVASGAFTIFLIALYLGERIAKNVKIPNALQSNTATVILGCLNEIVSVGNLYGAGYLIGSYTQLAWVAEALKQPLENPLPGLYISVVFNSAVVAISTIGIAWAMYHRGCLHGTRLASHSSNRASYSGVTL
jgi:hypothetical protein